jgi:hypothetical protein
MKNIKTKWWSILTIAIVAVIGFSACKDEPGEDDTGWISGGGTFTLTNINADYNGKYIFFEAQKADKSIYIKGVQSHNEKTLQDKLVKVSDGKAVFSLFWSKPYTYGSSQYYGNDTFTIGEDTVNVWIFDNESGGEASGSLVFLSSRGNELVFVNGSAEKSARDGLWTSGNAW